MMFEKPCKRCQELFRPKGKYCYFCDKCKKQKGRNTKPTETELDRHKKSIVDLRNRLKTHSKGQGKPKKEVKV